MIIDFHTHIFPEKVALSTLNWIRGFTGLHYHVNGTGEDLRRSMDESGVDLSITMPIVTKPGSMHKINDYAAEQAKKWGFLSFGSVHPEAPDWKEEIRRFHDLGLVGLKIHNDYQGFSFDSPVCRAIIETAYEEGLPVLVHPGYDPVSPWTHGCTPKMIRDALPLLTQGTFIAAHMGGHMMMDDAMESVIGSDIYLDVSMVGVYNTLEVYKRSVLAHDPDKILFGTDSPWDGQKVAVERLRSLGLGQETEDKILGQNARKLLRLEG